VEIKEVTVDTSRLNSIHVFSGVSDAEREFAAAWATELSVPAGTIVMLEDDFAYDMLMIVEGTAEVRHGDVLVAQLGPGDVVGEIGVVTRGMRSATVIATSPLMAIRLSRWEMRRLEAGAPNAANAIKRLAASRSAQAA
jgi:CRP-like cAMP-binding protein